MRVANSIEVPSAVLEILTEETDKHHLLSASEIGVRLQELEIPCSRKTIYRAIDVLNTYGFQVHYENCGSEKGYWIEHPFSPAEAWVLSDAVSNTPSLSEKETFRMQEKVFSVLSSHERKTISRHPVKTDKTKNDHVLDLIGILLEAVRDGKPVEFVYYDITVTRQKRYRRSHSKYHLIPYMIVSGGGRFYCVFYSEKHQSFANYRLDKMEEVKVLDEPAEAVPFDPEAHIRSSFQMYTGDAQTVTAEFDISLSNIVFDQFGSDIIITKVTDQTFTAAIRTALTPTLTGWLLQFYDRATVLHPQSLKDELCHIAETLTLKYNRENKEGKDHGGQDSETAGNH